MADTSYRDCFQQNAEKYDAITRSKHVQLIYRLEEDVLRRYFATIDAQSKTVLDFACGTGRWTQLLQTQFRETTGVDVSEDMLHIARQRCENVRFVCADITADRAEALPGQPYDVVTAFRFYKNAEADLRQSATQAIAEVLKDNGVFIFDLHLNTFSVMGLLASLLRGLKLGNVLGLNALGLKTLSLRTLRKLFRDSPFEIIDVFGMGVLPGRSNYTLLPGNMLYRVERFFTERKMLRTVSYNILVFARKKKAVADAT